MEDEAEDALDRADALEAGEIAVLEETQLDA